MSLADDLADDGADVPTGDEEFAAEDDAPAERSGGIDLSKFVPDVEGGEEEEAPADGGAPAETVDDAGDAGDVGEVSDVGDDSDVSDEELEQVRPLVADESETEEGDEEDAKGSRRRTKATAPVDPHLRAAVEAVIFAADEPVTPGQVAKATGAKPGVVKKAILQIQGRLDSTGSGLLLQEIGGGFTFTTHAEHAPAIRALKKTSQGRKLSPAAVDTLTIVAYKQPVQRQEIEDVRGVASCGPMLRQLMQLDLVKIVGRAEALGKPLLYGTTKGFLGMFGLADIKDLPKVSELEPQ